MALKHGICSPARVIATASATVFNTTVFPPAFEPVIITDLNGLPMEKSFSITLSSMESNTGFFIAFSSMTGSCAISGSQASMLAEYFAFANIKSSSVKVSKDDFISSQCSQRRYESSFKIL